MKKITLYDKKRLTSGFTIVELIVVITVIGILATIGIVSYNGWQDSVTATQLKSDLQGAAAAMENYRNFHSGYPATVEESGFKFSAGVTVIGGSSDGGKTFSLTASKGDDVAYSITNGTEPVASAVPAKVVPDFPPAPKNVFSTVIRPFIPRSSGPPSTTPINGTITYTVYAYKQAYKNGLITGDFLISLGSSSTIQNTSSYMDKRITWDSVPGALGYIVKVTYSAGSYWYGSTTNAVDDWQYGFVASAGFVIGQSSTNLIFN